VRILTVEPGPNFSVADVHRGWVKALKAAGHQVANMSFAARLEFYEKARTDPDGRERFTTEEAVRLASKGILTACYELWPDVVLITSGFYVPDDALQLMRDRGHKVVMLHTESPYEDDKQIQRAQLVDLNLINDPTNIDRFPPNTVYAPHAYDPDVHHPADVDPAWDFSFVGTGYPSRVEFFERVDFDGIEAALAGNWQAVTDTSPLNPLLLNDRSECFPNDLTADLYRRTRISANLYRKEAHHVDLVDGWAMGPREVELAACGAFYMTEERGENREVLPMVPTFSTPDEFGELLRWWLAHPEARAEVARGARAAVADRTFDSNVRLLTQHI
jgi:spore maturation protein CgeB